MSTASNFREVPIITRTTHPQIKSKQKLAELSDYTVYKLLLNELFLMFLSIRSIYSSDYMGNLFLGKNMW